MGLKESIQRVLRRNSDAALVLLRTGAALAYEDVGIADEFSDGYAAAEELIPAIDAAVEWGELIVDGLHPEPVRTAATPKHPVYVRRPLRPIASLHVAPTPLPSAPPLPGPVLDAPTGWQLRIEPVVAERIVAWWLGRPDREWSARLLIRSEVDRETKIVWLPVAYDIFFTSGSDSAAHSTIDADAEWKLIQELRQSGRKLELPNLAGHIHSHHDMSPFWSNTDESLVGMLVSEQTALQTRLGGWVVTLIVGADLAIAARVSIWNRAAVARAPTYSQYHLPVIWKIPEKTPVADLLASRKENRHASIHATASYFRSGDGSGETWEDWPGWAGRDWE